MHSTLFSLLALLTAAVVAVALLRHFRIPGVLAYLAIGIAFGPHGSSILTESDQVSAFAEFGVVFLMFSIGLEFSLPRLIAMRSLVFGLGSAQMLLTTGGTLLIASLAYGQNWRAALAVGLAVAMSSTAIVAKMLSDRFELHSRSGRQTMGVLLFQDLAVVPCLIILPALADAHGDLWHALALAGLQAGALLIALVWIGQRAVRKIYDRVASQRSDELFVLTTLWIVVGLAFATGQAGLSLALGAFVGGMLLSETIYRHQVEADIRPFRDMLLGLFFVTVGMQLDLGIMSRELGRLLLALLLIVAGKGLVVLLITLVARTTLDVALRTATQLAQAGEFGLVLIAQADILGLISADVFQVTLSAMLLSMFLAPFLIERAARLGGEMARGDWAHKAKAIHDIAVAGFALERHVIICGYGRTGQHVGQFLASENIAFLALDVDPCQARQRPPEGSQVAFGNADRPEVLKAAGLARASAVVIAYPDVQSAERVLHLIRRQRSDIPVVVRAPDDSHAERLRSAGATEVIPEVLEGSLMIAAETLVQLNVPVERAMMHVRAVRADRYASLRDYYRNGTKPLR
jgi:CPA2 family monovalent cation:H+ antiporter-2